MAFHHTSVLLDEVMDGLCIRPGGVYLDGTLGGAGHSLAILKRLNGTGRLVGIDQDEDALNAAKVRLKAYEEQVTFVHENFSHSKQILRDFHIERIDGAVLDLGVSSYQLDEKERGFSYRFDAPLDMRMDQSKRMTAADILNTYSKEDLAGVIRRYGEEKFASRIAERIVKRREVSPLKTTSELVECIEEAIPMKARRTGGHPAKRTFQAIRIELNEELTILEQSLDDLIDVLSPGGRLCVITFHSLEDRIVKECFKRNMDPCVCPPDFPVCVCGKKPTGRVVTKKPIEPGDEERAANPRSASAKLRIFERAAKEDRFNRKE